MSIISSTGRFIYLFLTLFIPFSSGFAQLSLKVIYPRENLKITPKDSMFIFGSVNDPSARVRVNDLPVKMYPNGAFLGMVPVQPDSFIFHCVAFNTTDTVEVFRRVYVVPYLMSTPRDTVVIDTSYLIPDENLTLTAGEYLQVAFKGTPGLVATFSIEGFQKKIPMVERPPQREFYWGEAVFGEGEETQTPPVEGIYTGIVQIPQGLTLHRAAITFELKGNDGITVSAVAPGRLTVKSDSIPQIGQLNQELTIARTGPGLGYLLFLPEGVKLWITGQKGDYVRARITETQSVWVPEQNIKILPEGTHFPHSVISVVRTNNRPDCVRVKIFMQERLPFQIEQYDYPQKLVVTIFGAISDTDWIRYDFTDSFIKNLYWTQRTDTVYQLHIELNTKQQWGYNPHYEGNDLVLDIKKPPESFKLKNLLICVDPGHGPDLGAIGPTGLTEMEANLRLALALKNKLEKKGATVFLTRNGNYGASLAVRPKMAALLGADLLLSVHHNAIPDGVNPFKSRGSSTYYYHPQSRPLAVAIQKRLLQKLKLPNFDLYYDNLTLCRPPQMPAVLIEPAFIMHPEEEILIKSADYPDKVADAIVKGIEDFLKQAKE